MKLSIPSCVSTSPFLYANATGADPRHRARTWTSDCIGVGSGASVDMRARLDLSSNSQLIESLGLDPDSGQTLPVIRWERLNTCESGMASSPVQRPPRPETPDIIRQAVLGLWRPGMASSSLVQRPQPPETPEIIQQVLQGGWESGMPSSPIQRPQPPETPEIIQQVLQGGWESGMPSSPVQRPQPPETPEIIRQVLQGEWEPGELSSSAQRPQPPETPDIIRQAVQGTWRPDMASSSPIQRPTFLATQEITWNGGARKRPTSQDSRDRREAMLMPTPAKIPRQRTRRYEKVTDALLMKCKALSGEHIENEGGIEGLARKYNVAWETLRKYVCASGGLTPRGEERLGRQKKKEVSDAMLEEWENLSKEQRDNEGGLRGFAKKHNVRFEALMAYARVSGGLSQHGNDRLHKDERAPLTNAMLVEWENLSREQIMDVGGLSGFAEKHNVCVKALLVYAREYGGLSPEGKDRVYRHKRNPVTQATLEQWKALNKKQIAKRGSVRRFAKKHNVSIFVLRPYVCASGGLTPRGEAKLAKLTELAKKAPSSA